MFFRQWRARRREAIAQKWVAEQMSLPPVELRKRQIDPVALENWQREQAAQRAAAGPFDALDIGTDDIAAKVEALWEWQTQFSPWLGKILNSHHDSLDFLENHRIRMVVQMFPWQAMIDSLIFTHPRPDMLLQTWNHRIPELIDEVSEMPKGLNENQQKEALAWQPIVKHFTRLVEQAVANYEKYLEEDDD